MWVIACAAVIFSVSQAWHDIVIPYQESIIYLDCITHLTDGTDFSDEEIMNVCSKLANSLGAKWPQQ